MDFKKFALCFIGMLAMMIIVNTNVAYAEETVNETDNISIEADNTDSSENTQINEEKAIAPEITAAPAAAPSQSPAAEMLQNVSDSAGSDEKEIFNNNDDNKKKSKKSNKKQQVYTKSELRLMSAIIFCEANLEPYAGKLAVGIVVMNRIESKAFPSDIRSVIYQPYQFSPVRNGSLKRALARYDAGKFKSVNEKQCIKAAKAALSGEKSVVYKGKTKSLKGYKFFSGYLSHAKYRIGGHLFR